MLEIIYPADDCNPVLRYAREHMIEPARIPHTFYRTVALPVNTTLFDLSKSLDKEAFIKSDEWQKELVVEPDTKTSYWVWRHIRTQAIFI